MGALFICRIQVSGGLLRYQLKNLSIGISMPILTTFYILHLSQLCCFLIFHFSPKTSKLFLMSIQRSIKAAKTQIKKKCKISKFSQLSTTNTNRKSCVFYSLWVLRLGGSSCVISRLNLCIQTVYFEGIIEKAYAPRQILASVIWHNLFLQNAIDLNISSSNVQIVK